MKNQTRDRSRFPTGPPCFSSTSSMLSSRPPATQNADECGAKFAVEYGVDDRIQRRVAVAEPEDDGEQALWNVEVEEQRERVDGEERKPASDE